MSEAPVVVGIGVVDAQGVAGTSGVAATWAELDADAPGTGRTFRKLFSRADPMFRRLDRAARALVIGAEAAGVSSVIPVREREGAALILETQRGSLESDFAYVARLAEGNPDPALFPFTLPSTCLGEVALRHGLMGPSVCLSVEAEQAGAALREAERRLSGGEARFVVAAQLEVLAVAHREAEPALSAVVAVVAPPSAVERSVAPWPAAQLDPFAVLAGVPSR